MNWKANIAQMMQEHGSIRENGERASDATQDRIKQTFMSVFNLLHRDGLRVDAPANLKEKHIEHLVQAWHAKGKAPKSMQTDLYALRVMLNRMGKRGLVKSLKDYLPHVDPKTLKVSTIARKSKSWSEAGIDMKTKIAEADALDPRFGLMLRLMLTFGLRRKEVLNCRPHIASVIPGVWQVFPSEGKGTRPRQIPVTSDLQREVIAYVCQRVKPKEAMRWAAMKNGKPMTIKQALDKYNRMMAQIGITKDLTGVSGHGLRAQFAENDAVNIGYVPATLGGKKGSVDAEQLFIYRSVGSQSLGHRREDISTAYGGSFGRNAPVHVVDFLQRSIAAGLEHMAETKTQNPTIAAYRDDCLQMIAILAAYDIEITIGQVQTLWQKYSDRHCCDWLKPAGGEGEIERGLQVAATMHLRKQKEGDQAEKGEEDESKLQSGIDPDALDSDKI